VGAISALLAVVPCLLISEFVSRSGSRGSIRIAGWRELPGAQFLSLFLAPVISTLCLWQPRLLVSV
jgi:hypothetical protein